MCGCLSHTPYWGPGPQPRHVPQLGIEPATLWFTARAQFTELYQPGPYSDIFLLSVLVEDSVHLGFRGHSKFLFSRLLGDACGCLLIMYRKEVTFIAFHISCLSPPSGCLVYSLVKE